jgi:hypothetical protein
MMQDAQGRFVPVACVRPQDQQRDEMVRNLFAAFELIRRQCQQFRQMADGEIDAHLGLVEEKYGEVRRGQVGNLVLTSYDGSLRICRAVDKLISFTEELQAAKKLIFECVEEWTAGARPELRALVEDAFRADKAGRLSADRILGLRRLEIADPHWKSAMQAISDSVRVDSTRTYLRFYRRQADGTYLHIPSGV